MRFQRGRRCIEEKKSKEQKEKKMIYITRKREREREIGGKNYEAARALAANLFAFFLFLTRSEIKIAFSGNQLPWKRRQIH